MKISYTILSLVIFLAILTGTAVMGYMLLQQQDDRDFTLTELTAAKDALMEHQGNASILAEELAVAEEGLAIEQSEIEQARIEADRTYFPDKISSGGILNSVLQLAQSNNLTVVEVITQPEDAIELDIFTFSGLSVDLLLTGSLSNISIFTNKLEKGDIRAVSIAEISLEGAEDLYNARLYFSVLYPQL